MIRGLTIMLVSAAVVAGSVPASAIAPRTTLVSKTSGGAPANSDSLLPSISASGRFVAFYSGAFNLPGRDATQDVYVHDRRIGRTTLVSRTSRGTPANRDSFAPSISASGRFVTFYSRATNLPGRDATEDVYVHDRRTGRTTLVSKTSGGSPANADSLFPSISASGRLVAFQSSATNLPGHDAIEDVYVHDRDTGRTRLVSKTSGGSAADGDSASASISSISASGRFVAFLSRATNLPGNDAYWDVYVHNRVTGRTSLVSKTSGGTPADGESSISSISASGRFVAFSSEATNLPGNDAHWDVYVHNRRTGTTRLVSKTSGGSPADGGDSFAPSISTLGRFVAFESGATNLPGNDVYVDVYVHDRRTGRTRLVSKTSGGSPADGDSGGPSISASGRIVAFHSGAANLPGDDAYLDVYVHGPLPV